MKTTAEIRDFLKSTRRTARQSGGDDGLTNIVTSFLKIFDVALTQNSVTGETIKTGLDQSNSALVSTADAVKNLASGHSTLAQQVAEQNRLLQEVIALLMAPVVKTISMKRGPDGKVDVSSITVKEERHG